MGIRDENAAHGVPHTGLCWKGGRRRPGRGSAAGRLARGRQLSARRALHLATGEGLEQLDVLLDVHLGAVPEEVVQAPLHRDGRDRHRRRDRRVGADRLDADRRLGQERRGRFGRHFFVFREVWCRPWPSGAPPAARRALCWSVGGDTNT